MGRIGGSHGPREVVDDTLLLRLSKVTSLGKHARCLIGVCIADRHRATCAGGRLCHLECGVPTTGGSTWEVRPVRLPVHMGSMYGPETVWPTPRPMPACSIGLLTGSDNGLLRRTADAAIWRAALGPCHTTLAPRACPPRFPWEGARSASTFPKHCPVASRTASRPHTVRSRRMVTSQ
jgi:hypothetical protein